RDRLPSARIRSQRPSMRPKAASGAIQLPRRSFSAPPIRAAGVPGTRPSRQRFADGSNPFRNAVGPLRMSGRNGPALREGPDSFPTRRRTPMPLCRSLRPWGWMLTVLLAQAIGISMVPPQALAQEVKPQQQGDKADREKDQKGEVPAKPEKPPIDLRAIQSN